MRRRLVLFLSLGLIGCIHHPTTKTPTSAPTTEVDLDPIRITATVKDGKVQSEAYDAKSLFEEATDAFNRGDYATAAKDFARVYKEFPGSPYDESARYNTGLSLESQEQWQDALA